MTTLRWSKTRGKPVNTVEKTERGQVGANHETLPSQNQKKIQGDLQDKQKKPHPGSRGLTGAEKCQKSQQFTCGEAELLQDGQIVLTSEGLLSKKKKSAAKRGPPAGKEMFATAWGKTKKNGPASKGSPKREKYEGKVDETANHETAQRSQNNYEYLGGSKDLKPVGGVPRREDGPLTQVGASNNETMRATASTS